MIGFWFFLTVVACLMFVAFVMLMKVRITDTRADRVTRQYEQDRVSQEAMAVINQNKRLEEKRYEYGIKQAEFGQRVLALVEAGVWNGDLEEIKAACVRQLDGIAPPPHAPQMVMPKAEMPDFSPARTYRNTAGYYETRRM